MADDALGTVTLDNADDAALADRMKNGRAQILDELRKLIVGQKSVRRTSSITLSP